MRPPPGAALLAFLALLLALAGLAVAPADVRAADPQATIEAEPMQDGTWLLTSRVTSADGAAQSRVDVTFVAATDFFGSRWVPLGTAVTDTSGTASFLYTPTWNGQQTLVARPNAEGLQASEPIRIDVSGAAPGVAPETDDLPLVRAWAMPLGIALVVSVWIVLALLFLTAVIGIVRAGASRQAHHALPQIDGLQTAGSRVDVDGGSPT